MEKIEDFFTDAKFSEIYAKYRPNLPSQVIETVVDFVSQKLQPPFNQTVDVGCGSGLSTSVLSPHFKSVLGIDISKSQINLARKMETNFNVHYEIGSCNSIPLPNQSAELLIACLAAHWFNLPEFFTEVNRVLVPGGVIAITGYSLPEAYGQPYSAEINKLLSDFFHVTLGPYQHPSNDLAVNYYCDVILPYPEQSREYFVIPVANWSIESFVGQIQSWSACNRLMKEKPERAKEAIAEFQKSMFKIVGDNVSLEKEIISVRWKFVLIMSRKPMVYRGL